MEKTKKKYINKYETLVDKLGRHPSTTELQNSKRGRVLYNAICKYFGSFERFRNEFGIKKSEYFVDLNGKERWKEALRRSRKTRSQNKEDRKKRVLEFVLKNSNNTVKSISEGMNLKENTVYNYLNELERECKVNHSLSSRKKKVYHGVMESSP